MVTIVATLPIFASSMHRLAKAREVHFDILRIEAAIPLLPIGSASYLLKLLVIAARLIGAIKAVFTSALDVFRDVAIIGTEIIVGLDAPIVALGLPPALALDVNAAVTGAVTASSFITLPVARLPIAIPGTGDRVTSQPSKNAADYGTSNVMGRGAANGSPANRAYNCSRGMILATASVCVGGARCCEGAKRHYGDRSE